MTELSWRSSRQFAAFPIDSKAMNTKLAIVFVVLFTAFGSGCATSHHAKISRADAERVALGKVPGGTVKEAELEKEHGRLIWSFDIATPGSTIVTEIHVDANTGNVIATEEEDEAHERKEKSGKN
jgi:uncharacterized membrane protein YkoI